MNQIYKNLLNYLIQMIIIIIFIVINMKIINYFLEFMVIFEFFQKIM